MPVLAQGLVLVLAAVCSPSACKVSLRGWKFAFLVNHPQFSDLSTINEPQERESNLRNLNEKFGGPEQLCRMLKVDPAQGLSHDLDEPRKQQFGQNVYDEPPFRGFWLLFLDSFKDYVLLILIAAAVVATGSTSLNQCYFCSGC